MSGPWFIAPPEGWGTDEIVLSPEESHHALKVLRVKVPDLITITDGRGTVAHASAARVEDGCLIAAIVERHERRAPTPEIVVYQGAAKGAKLDAVVERLAEVGAAECWVFSSERSVVKWDAAKEKRMGERFEALAASAAKQSRNPYVMTTGVPISWTELLRRVAREPLALTLWEEADLPLRTGFEAAAKRIALIVGPEGGFTREEAEALAEHGSLLVSLGPRILRTENAALVATSALLFHHGLIG